MMSQQLDLWIPPRRYSTKALLVTCSLWALATTALDQHLDPIKANFG